MSDQKFLASLRELVPSLPDGCLVPAHSGVRAQALHRDGSLVDDFYYERGIRQIHVLNAPSPAATAALEIGRRVADELEVALEDGQRSRMDALVDGLDKPFTARVCWGC